MKYMTVAKTLWLGLALFVFAIAVVPTAQAQSTEQAIRQMLEQRDRQIKSILQGDTSLTETQRQELMTLINGFVDFRAMGRQALGPFWSDLTEAQRTEFVEVFRTIVRSQSLADLEVYNSEVTYDAITVEGDSAYVVTTTTYQNTAANIEYDLAFKDSTWLAEDIIIDDVSTAQSYARSFQTAIRKRGFDAFMESLRKKRDQVTAQT